MIERTMSPENPVAELARLIQLSVAPVFLLTGAATLLSALGTWLGRVVDRTRILADRLKVRPRDQQAQLRAGLTGETPVRPGSFTVAGARNMNF